jgi:hypothetical protein
MRKMGQEMREEAPKGFGGKKRGKKKRAGKKRGSGKMRYA